MWNERTNKKGFFVVCGNELNYPDCDMLFNKPKKGRAGMIKFTPKLADLYTNAGLIEKHPFAIILVYDNNRKLNNDPRYFHKSKKHMKEGLELLKQIIVDIVVFRNLKNTLTYEPLYEQLAPEFSNKQYVLKQFDNELSLSRCPKPGTRETDLKVPKRLKAVH